MKFRPEHYLQAAEEQVNSARRLHKQKRYPAAIYLAGVAVECLLLAYKTRENPGFESRHDLRSLLKESGMIGFIRPKERRKLSILMGNVWARWKNNYRFASYDRLTSEFRRLELNRGIKGEFLKPNSDIVIDNAYEIINLGVRRWTSEKN